jgi:predicted nicotinamide N-methyase
VLDLGAGGGLVGTAALKLGAASVLASDIDPIARQVAQMNASLNDVTLTPCGDLTEGKPPDVDLILVGDLFYAPDLATRVLPFLQRAAGQGIMVLVGDIGRADLPVQACQTLSIYPVRDVGDTPATALHKGRVLLLPAGSGSPGT